MATIRLVVVPHHKQVHGHQYPYVKLGGDITLKYKRCRTSGRLNSHSNTIHKSKTM